MAKKGAACCVIQIGAIEPTQTFPRLPPLYRRAALRPLRGRYSWEREAASTTGRTLCHVHDLALRGAYTGERWAVATQPAARATPPPLWIAFAS